MENSHEEGCILDYKYLLTHQIRHKATLYRTHNTLPCQCKAIPAKCFITFSSSKEEQSHGKIEIEKRASHKNNLILNVLVA